MRDVLQGHVVGSQVPALVSLVSRRGETHVEAFGTDKDPVRRDSIFRIASLTKPVAAAAAMILVEECRLRLDDPVDEFLPELADRRVLKRIDGPLEDTVPANRPISTRDLLTLRLGLGYIMQPGEFPVMKAAQEMGLLVGPPMPQSMPDPDEWMRRVGTLPLMYQPGEQWMYDIGFDILGVLIARASGQPLGAFFKERIFNPLGMKDTDFYVPTEKHDRFTTTYRRDPSTGGFVVFDGREDSQWGCPGPFPSAGGGLVSTADDYLAFCQMLLDGGGEILSRPSVELMTGDRLSPGQAAAQPIFFGADRSWGFGTGIVTRRTGFPSVGTHGWTGGLGSIALTDPREKLISILLTLRTMDSPQLPKVFTDFQTSAYQAIAD